MVTKLAQHSYYKFSEIQDALESIGKRDLCEGFGDDWNETLTFYLTNPENNLYYGEPPTEQIMNELIAALRTLGVTEDEITIVSFD